MLSIATDGLLPMEHISLPQASNFWRKPFKKPKKLIPIPMYPKQDVPPAGWNDFRLVMLYRNLYDSIM